jgi:UDP-N-acetylmuramate dehydrogenase
VGAVPVQNVGAYGQDAAQSLVRLEAWDWWSRRRVRVDAPDCRFGYRTSRFKQHPGRYTILSVTLALQRSQLSRPVNYAQLATELDVSLGTHAPLADVRAAVLAIRRRKGMVIDPADAESRSVGSFFLNPAVPTKAWDRFVRRVRAMCGELPPELTRSPDSVRTSAGWLMQRAGFSRGQRFGSARISHKHTLALVAEDKTTATA